MKGTARQFLLWMMALLRVVGGFPYTWTGLKPAGVLQPQRRRGLLVWSGLVLLYLVSMSIYMTRIAVLEYSKSPKSIKSSIILANKIAVTCSPAILILNAIWKANKIANVLRAVSFVHQHYRTGHRSAGRHWSIIVTLGVSVLCALAGIIKKIQFVSEYNPSLSVERNPLIPDSIFNAILYITVVFLNVTGSQLT